MPRQNTSEVKDWRSTGRKRARRALFESGREFKCAGVPEQNLVCNKTTTSKPSDAPKNFDDIWPEELRVLSTASLQADHENKDVTDNDPANLEWRCSSCHRIHDNLSGVGESTVTDLSGYRRLA